MSSKERYATAPGEFTVDSSTVLPTGDELFNAMTEPEQNAAIGSEAAELVRAGAPLKDFVSHSRIETQDDYLTQRPVEEVTN